jgi:2-polyprenyl-3-methyl-5-hydroxy-6-metoxy-1,4-benzoquinol methylase
MQVNMKEHWENVFSSKKEDEVSWFQRYPKTSMDFIELVNLPFDANIIDVGGGDSYLVDVLLDKGYRNIWVLDISAKAIERAKQRLGVRASKVNWIISDITEFNSPVQFDFWHDRAAFHCLTTEDKILKYVSIAKYAIKKNGYLVLGTFSEDGPRKCSGLDIKQYSETSMTIQFEADFERIKCHQEDHNTPSGKDQNFLYCIFRRN